jgi:uncharacterized protein YyaL (SSP411 family)
MDSRDPLLLYGTALARAHQDGVLEPGQQQALEQQLGVVAAELLKYRATSQTAEVKRTAASAIRRVDAPSAREPEKRPDAAKAAEMLAAAQKELAAAEDQRDRTLRELGRPGTSRAQVEEAEAAVAYHKARVAHAQGLRETLEDAKLTIEEQRRIGRLEAQMELLRKKLEEARAAAAGGTAKKR